MLVPLTYHGILDDTVDYAALPWRNGQFDPMRWRVPSPVRSGLSTPLASGDVYASSARWPSASRPVMPILWPASSSKPVCGR